MSLSHLSRIRNDKKGFTLLEMLVAITILVVVVSAVYSALRSLRSSWAMGEGTAKRYSTARGVLDFMVRQLRGAIINDLPLEAGYVFYGIDGYPENIGGGALANNPNWRGFEGCGDQIYFFTPSDTPEGTTVAEVGYWLDSDYWEKPGWPEEKYTGEFQSGYLLAPCKLRMFCVLSDDPAFGYDGGKSGDFWNYFKDEPAEDIAGVMAVDVVDLDFVYYYKDGLEWKMVDRGEIDIGAGDIVGNRVRVDWSGGKREFVCTFLGEKVEVTDNPLSSVNGRTYIVQDVIMPPEEPDYYIVLDGFPSADRVMPGAKLKVSVGYWDSTGDNFPVDGKPDGWPGVVEIILIVRDRVQKEQQAFSTQLYFGTAK